MDQHTAEKALPFNDRAAWRKWLSDNGTSEKAVWLIHYKKHSGLPSVTRQEALEEALCFGWIDSVIRSINENSYMQRYTPRTKKSNWSDRNKMLVRELLAAGKMADPGLSCIKGWINENPVARVVKSDEKIHAALEAALHENIRASEVFYSLSASQQRNIIRWINASKRDETLRRRISEAIETLKTGRGIGIK
ncbi:MAG TPA: YdeI/OmpD-associated family protein [Bacteroidales bacterium]|nr:YdeI/OmpD-associated family protein [Bacteroidales bacterium]